MEDLFFGGCVFFNFPLTYFSYRTCEAGWRSPSRACGAAVNGC